MKKLIFLSVILPIFLCSCRNESVELENGTTSSNIYLPTNAGNFWTYKVTGTIASRDSLFVERDNTIDGNVYKKMKTKAIPTGFFSTVLNGNSVRKSGDKILLSGNANIGFIPNLPISVMLSDFAMFKEVTNVNEEIDSKSGVIEQTISGFPIKIEYTLRSVGLAPLSGFTTSAGKTYANVKPIKYIITAKISSLTDNSGINFPIPFLIPILNSQDVVTSTQYFAKNKGMVYAKTVISYQLQPLPTSVNLNFPTSANQTQEEFLDTFLIN